MAGLSLSASPDGTQGMLTLGGQEVARFDLAGMLAKNVRIDGGIELSKFSEKLHATSGYQRLPGGLILQWGSVANVGAGGNVAVAFPIAYPNAVRVVTVGAQVLTALQPGAFRQCLHMLFPTLTGFTVENSDTSGVGAHWISIGH